MHFSREKLKEQAGWIILGFVILVALGFLGYQQLNGRVVEAQQEATRWESEATMAREDASQARWDLKLSQEEAALWESEAIHARHVAEAVQLEVTRVQDTAAFWEGEALTAQSAAAHWENEAMAARRERGQAEVRVVQLEARSRSAGTNSAYVGGGSSGGVGEIVRLAQGASSVQVIDVIRLLLPLTGLAGWVVQAILGFLLGS